jgi:hypothetical protein
MFFSQNKSVNEIFHDQQHAVYPNPVHHPVPWVLPPDYKKGITEKHGPFQVIEKKDSGSIQLFDSSEHFPDSFPKTDFL